MSENDAAVREIALPGRRDQIKIGSVWRSRDPRDKGREVTVLSEPSRWGNDYVVVQSRRQSRMRATTLLDRYNFVRPAPTTQADAEERA